MVKNILIIFGILISIFLMLVISLTNGFKIDNISFKNINIQGLYLKYDKKLIIDTRNISIGYLGNTKTVDMKIKFSIENFFGDYFLDVYEYVLFDPYLKASGKFVLDLNNMSLESILKDTNINDFALQFNKNLKFITADSCFVTFKDNNFYFSFKNPIYEGVNLDGSEATIIDLDRLQLKLTSHDKLKKPLLELLSNYKINLPITQENGSNTISTELLIPFDIKKELKVESKILLENAKIHLYNIPLYTKIFDIYLNNNILKGAGILHKEKDDNNTLEYNSDVVFDIDFKKNIVDGNFTTQNVNFKELELEDIKGNFNLDFNSSFFSNLIIKNGILTIKDEKFILDNSKSIYKNKNKTFYSNINLNAINLPINLKIDDRFNLLDINSSGNIEFQYDNNITKLYSNNITYRADYKENTNIDIFIQQLEGTILENNISLNNGQIKYSNERIKGDIENIYAKNNFLDLKAQNVLLDYNNENKQTLRVDTNNSKLFVNNIDIGLQSTKLQYQKNKLNIKNFIENKYSSVAINTDVDLLLKQIVGDMQISNSTKEKTDNFKYDINYTDEVLFNIPKLGFQLKKNSDNLTTLSVNQLLPLQNYFDFVGLNNKSKILLTRDKSTNININLDHISIVLDEYYNNILEKDKEKKINNNKTNLHWKNSFVQLNDYKFYFDKLNLRTIEENLHLDLQKKTTNLTIDRINGNTIIKSKKVDADYINLMFGKDILKDGYLEVFLTGGLANTYQGEIEFYNTTIVQMQLVDNLLLFLNSAPALINPFLVIPTVYRLTQNKFELGGYYIEDGLVKFNYNHLNRYLNIYQIDTNGKINDFSGDMRLNFIENTIDGKLRVSTLKDYAKVVNNIPLINSLFLDTKGQFSIPISIYGTIDNPSYKILNINESDK